MRVEFLKKLSRKERVIALWKSYNVYKHTNEQTTSSSVISPYSSKLSKLCNYGYAGVQTEKSNISHSVTTKVHQPVQHTPPGFSFQNLQGCTINTVNSAPPNITTCPSTESTVTDHTEIDIDSLIAEIKEPIQ